MQPRIEAIRVSEAAEVLPGADQGVLHGVLCQLGLTEDEAGNRKQATRAARREHREGIEVAVPGANHEVSLDRTVHDCRRRVPAITGVWAVEPGICSVLVRTISGSNALPQ